MSLHSRPSNSPPPLGDVYLDPDRTCMRLVSGPYEGKESLCGKPSVKHVEWSDQGSGFVCADHWQEVEAKGWSYNAAHKVGAACGMPGALWFDYTVDGQPESWCAYDGDGLPTAEPVRAVALEVNA